METGEIAWYFTHVPGESLDLDEAYERVLVDVDGRSVVLSIGKNGILWKLDRRDGTFLGLKETVYQDIFEEVNPRTGQVRYREDIRNMKIGEWLSVCPGHSGRTQLALDRLSSRDAVSCDSPEPELHGHCSPAGGSQGRRGRLGGQAHVEGEPPSPTSSASWRPTTWPRWRRSGAWSSALPSSPAC